MFPKLLLAASLVMSLPANADEITYLTGKVKLNKIQKEGDADILTLPLGKLASGKLNLFHEVKADKHYINGNAEFKNPTNKPVSLIYYIALKNQKGQLVAATNGDLQIAQPGKIHQFASALMPLPPQLIDQITNYDVVLYESDSSDSPSGN